MRKHNFFHSATKKLIQSVSLQLFLTTIYMPFLVAWGLPLSPLSGIATFFFTPFLTIFLFLASLIFLTELCALPNAILFIPLELITYLWHSLLSINVRSGLLPFPQVPLLLLIALPVAGCAVIACTWCKDPLKKIIGLSTIISLFLIIGTLIHKPPRVLTLLFHEKPITLIKLDSAHLALIDPGYLGSRRSSVSWVRYTLIPEIIQQMGINQIKHCICLQPTSYSFDALATLVEHVPVQAIYIPWWEGTVQKNMWRSYTMLQHACDTHRTMLIRLKKDSYTLEKNTDVSLLLSKEAEHISFHKAEYRAWSVEAFIDNTSLTFYAAKHISSQKEPYAKRKSAAHSSK